MAENSSPTDPFSGLFDMQGEAMREMWNGTPCKEKR